MAYTSCRFPTKYSLHRHETTHTNNKPHSCPFCNFACNMQGNLTKHIRNMHQQPDFSMRDYKRQQQTIVKTTKDKKKWTEKGQKAFDQYLNTLSEQLGRQVIFYISLFKLLMKIFGYCYCIYYKKFIWFRFFFITVGLLLFLMAFMKIHKCA